MAMLELDCIQVYFPIRRGQGSGKIHAVDGVSFNLDHGQALGLVGESGCGKTTVAMSIAGAVKITGGVIRFQGRDVSQLNKKQLLEIRRRVAMVFQDPYSSLNPRMNVLKIISEPLVINQAANGAQQRARVIELLREVGLEEHHLYRYPHEFSGGQRQRIGIARALALDTSLVIFDEPTSALDVSVQAQILKLIRDIRAMYNLAILLISHDLAVVKSLCERVAVMYLGQIIEIGSTRAIFKQPYHPYTRALLSSALSPSLQRKQDRIILTGSVPSPLNPPDGCRFKLRCFAHETEVCRAIAPRLQFVGPEHQVACWLAGERPIVQQGGITR